jgi:hypothetical protein
LFGGGCTGWKADLDGLKPNGRVCRGSRIEADIFVGALPFSASLTPSVSSICRNINGRVRANSKTLSIKIVATLGFLSISFAAKVFKRVSMKAPVTIAGSTPQRASFRTCRQTQKL